jgi:SAM-dependent methyltransferase
MELKEALLESGQFETGGTIYWQRGLPRPGKFETQYIALRRRENRLYTDAQVLHLPRADPENQHAREWQVRQYSLDILSNYLLQRTSKSILEIGCGNGWLSHQLAARTGASVCGLDINSLELQQAARVFGSTANLVFVYGDIFTFPHSLQFDTILLASSLQYFHDVEILLDNLLDRLSPEGELHIIDSPLYDDDEKASAAKVRSLKYFQSLDLPELSETYHHHQLRATNKFNSVIMYDPQRFITKVRRKLFGQPAPQFPWLKISKNH